jgi:hypothetical protein
MSRGPLSHPHTIFFPKNWVEENISLTVFGCLLKSAEWKLTYMVLRIGGMKLCVY